MTTKWALHGLATCEPLIVQAALVANYGAFQARFGACDNPRETLAGLGKGDYGC
jgi:hypothetical protein